MGLFSDREWDYRFLDVIDTDRCRLRPINKGDARDILQLYSNPNVIRFTEHYQPMQTLDEAEWSIHFYRKGYAERWMYRWGITIKDVDVVIGTAGLHRVNREHHHSAIGYEIDEPYWNRGFTTEVVNSLVRYGFETFDLHRIEAELIPENLASARVLQKNGFRYEATRRQRLYNKRQFRDLDVYGILRHEWEAIQNNT